MATMSARTVAMNVFLIINFLAEGFAVASASFRVKNPVTGKALYDYMETEREKAILSEYAAPMVMGGSAILSLTILIFGEQECKTGWANLFLGHAFISVMLVKALADRPRPHFLVEDPMEGVVYHSIMALGALACLLTTMIGGKFQSKKKTKSL